MDRLALWPTKTSQRMSQPGGAVLTRGRSDRRHPHGAGEASRFGRVGFQIGLLLLPLTGLAGELPQLVVAHATTTPALTAAANDPAWRNVPWTALTAEGPALPDTATDVAVQWDETFLFVRFRCRGIGFAAHGAVHDAPHHEGEVVEVFLDPTGRQQGFMEVQLSPAGGVLDKWWSLATPLENGADGVLTNAYIQSRQREDASWSLNGRCAVARLTTKGRTTGWMADLALPWTSAGGSPRAGDRLRAHFIRIARPMPGGASGYFSWAPVPIGRPHRAPALMGVLELAPAPSAPLPAGEGRNQ